MVVLLIVDTVELVVVLTELVAMGVRERWAKELRGARITAETTKTTQANRMEPKRFFQISSIMKNLRSNSPKIKGNLLVGR